MSITRNIIIQTYQGRDCTADISVPEGKQKFPVAVFLHGFKGFKDWGYFPFLHEVFNAEGIGLVTVNFSHNGVPASTPGEFSDLEGFKQNTITQELKEIGAVIGWMMKNAETFGWDPGAIALIGHSRGGGEAIVHASTDDRINRVICWAPISDFGMAFNTTDKTAWQKEGHVFIPNARTGQQLPVGYTFWEDLQLHQEDYDIPDAASRLEMPVLLIHGTADESVPVSNSEKIYEQCLHALLIHVPDGTHTFNAGHPWQQGEKFPIQLQDAIVNTIEFIID